MGVDFDIDEFIGSTSLEDKWQALDAEEIRQIRALYDGCTRQFDDCVKRILASLERNGLRDDTIIIVTSDHGDDLYEPGLTLGHGLTFNGSARSFHVPLIIHVPGNEGRTIDKQVRLLDVAPTLAGLLGIEVPEEWEGSNLAPWVRGEAAPEALPFYGETSFPFVQFKVEGVERPPLPPMDEMTFIDPDYNYQFVIRSEYEEPVLAAKQRCLMTERWKLVCTPAADGSRHFALFHLVHDPDSLKDLADERPEILEPMRTALELWIDRKIETSVRGIFPAGEP
jgi:arylsulfatase A-like enzyme